MHQQHSGTIYVQENGFMTFAGKKAFLVALKVVKIYEKYTTPYLIDYPKP